MTAEDFPRGGGASSNDTTEKVTKRVAGDAPCDRNSGGLKKLRLSGKNQHKDLHGGVWTRNLTVQLCQPGLLALGCVKVVGAKKIHLELPGGIAAAADLNFGSADTGGNSVEDSYSPGQLLPCQILTNPNTETKRKSSSILPVEVSCHPEKINSSLLLSSLLEGMNISCTVLSKEDRGYEMSLGVSPVKAFLPFSQMATESELLCVDQCLLCQIVEVKGRTVRLTRKPEKLEQVLSSESFSDVRKNQLVPGMIFRAEIERTLTTGVVVSFGENIKGFLRNQHLPRNKRKLGEGDTVGVMVTYAEPNTNMVGLSGRNHLLRITADKERTTFDGLKIGDIIEEAVVTRVTPKEAVYFRISTELMGVANRKLLQVKSGDIGSVYSIGSKHKCRIVGYSLIDRILRLTTSKSVMKQKFVSIRDAVPGQLLAAVKVESVKPSGIYVRIYDSFRGYIPPLYTADIPLLKPEKSVKSGQKMKCRVLYADLEKNRLVLCAKKTMVASDLPPVCAYNPENIGKITDGVVVKVLEYSVLISLYGHAKGLIRMRELKSAGITRPKSELKLGQPVKVKILSVDPGSEKMIFDLVTTKSSSFPLKSSCKIEIQNARVEEITSDGLKLTLIPDGVPGFLPKEHLTDFNCPELVNPLLNFCFKPGEFLEVALFSFKSDVVTVTLKPILLDAVKQGKCPAKFEELETGVLVYGVISRKHPELGYFVDLPGDLSGLCVFGNVGGGGRADLQVGQTVIGNVNRIELEKHRFSLTLRSEFCYPQGKSPKDFPVCLLKQLLTERELIRICAAKSKIQKHQILAELKEGSVLESVEIENVCPDGLICDLGLGAGLKGIVTSENLGKIQNEKLKKGEKCKAVVLYIDYDQECAELSIAGELTKKVLSSSSVEKNVNVTVDKKLNARIILIKSEWILAWLESEKRFAYLPRRMHPNETMGSEAKWLKVGKKIPIIVKESCANGVLLAISEKYESSLKEFEWEGKDFKNPRMVLERKGKIRMGAVYSCQVVGVKANEHFLEVQFPAGSKGRIHSSELVDEVEQEGVKPLESFWEENRDKSIAVKCIGFHSEKRRGGIRYAECTVRKSKLETVKRKKTNLGYQTRFSVGEVVPVFVSVAFKDKVRFSVNPLWNGTVPQLHLSTNLAVVRRPGRHFALGEIYLARVLGRNLKQRHLNLTLLSLEEIDVECGRACVGRIVRSEDSDVMFELTNGQVGVAGWTDLTDDYEEAKSVKEKAAFGNCMKVLPLTSDESGRKWKVSLRKSLLRKKAKVQPKDPHIEDADALKRGQVLRGFVKECQDKGVLVLLSSHPYLVGRVPLFKLEKSVLENRQQLLSPGTLVTVSVLSVSDRKVELSMLSKEIGGTVEEKQPNPVRKRKRTDSLLSDRGSSISEGSGQEESRIPRFEDVVSGKSSKKLDLEIGGGFNWEPEEFSMDNLISVGLSAEENGAEDAGNSEEITQPPEHKKRKKSAFEREKDLEDFLYQKELALLNPNIATEVDRPEDFDRLLFGLPNSSYLWLRYMAHFVKNGKVDKARVVAERALNTVDRREAGELFNIWTGMLNLENNFGSEDSLQKVFERARKGTDNELKIYIQLLKIYQNSEKTEEADKLCEEILKKFRHADIDTWITVGSYFMDTKRPHRCRELMQRAINSLFTKDHVQLLSRFAQIEFKNPCGDSERGKTIFENILASYPKKMDIWSVYVDMVVKYGSITEARPILERVTGLKLNAYQMRFLFKKWLELEERYGNEGTQKQVKEKAVTYVKVAEKELIG